MVERIGANGMPMKPKEDEMLSEILEVNPNKKSKKADKKKKDEGLSSEWVADEEVKDEEL